MLLCSAWAWRDTCLNQSSDEMKSSGEGGHQIPQQQNTCTGVKKAPKMRHLERKLQLIAEIQLIQWKKRYPVWEKLMWQRESFLGALWNSKWGDRSLFTVDLECFTQNCPMLQVKGSHFCGSHCQDTEVCSETFSWKVNAVTLESQTPDRSNSRSFEILHSAQGEVLYCTPNKRNLIPHCLCTSSQNDRL